MKDKARTLVEHEDWEGLSRLLSRHNSTDRLRWVLDNGTVFETFRSLPYMITTSHECTGHAHGSIMQFYVIPWFQQSMMSIAPFTLGYQGRRQRTDEELFEVHLVVLKFLMEQVDSGACILHEEDLKEGIRAVLTQYPYPHFKFVVTPAWINRNPSR